VLPLSGGRVYCYATANAAANRHVDDELAELQYRFGDRHAPIPEILGSVSSADVLRTDISEIAAPLPAMHRGRLAFIGDAAHAMTPDLGQSGCQAIEDAMVLASSVGDGAAGSVPDDLRRFTEALLNRTSDVVRRSRTAGRIYQLPAPVARFGARLMAVTPSAAVARSLAPTVGWTPPNAGSPHVEGPEPSQ
jgi:2-polyprenyl-6-methoxyphenol hydroxylase-like FAD-dependent oxidoreductase